MWVEHTHRLRRNRGSVWFGLQEVKLLFQSGRWTLMDELTDQEGQFMSVLTDGRNTQSSRPIVVQMSQFVCELLMLIGRQSGCVVDDVVAGRRNGSDATRLGDEEKVVPD